MFTAKAGKKAITSLLAAALLLTAMACSSDSPPEEEIAADASFETMSFDEPAPQPAQQPQEAAPNPQDADPEIERLIEQIDITNELIQANNLLIMNNENEIRRINKEIEDEREVSLRRLELFRQNLPQLVQQEAQVFGGELSNEMDRRLNNQISKLDHEYLDLLREIRDTYSRYEESYRLALERIPAPAAQQMPFMQAAMNRHATDLELVLIPNDNAYLLHGLGEARIFNLNPEDQDKVAGFKMRRGDADSRGIVPGFVNYRFPNEAYRASHYVEVTYYLPNSDEEAKLDNSHGQGLHFKPTLPIASSCDQVILFTSEYKQNTWQPWKRGPDACDPRGVNHPGRYIVAPASNLLQANFR